MNKKTTLLSALFSVIFCSTAFTQTIAEDSQQDYSNKCGQAQYHEYLRSKDPKFDMKMQQMEDAIQQWITDHPEDSEERGSVVWTIPLVVHVVYNNNTENVSDAQVINMVSDINDDFRRTNPDAVNTPVAFQ